MDAPHGTILPDEFNVVLSDISPEDLATKISQALHCPYMSPAQSSRKAKVIGCIYGPNLRSMFTLPVSCKGSTYNVHFFFNTGSPATHLASSALAAWDIPAWDLDNHISAFNGCRIRPSCSDAQVWNAQHDRFEKRKFEGVNLLGMDFLFKAGAEFNLNGKTNSCSLSFPCKDLPTSEHAHG